MRQNRGGLEGLKLIAEAVVALEIDAFYREALTRRDVEMQVGPAVTLVDDLLSDFGIGVTMVLELAGGLAGNGVGALLVEEGWLLNLELDAECIRLEPDLVQHEMGLGVNPEHQRAGRGLFNADVIEAAQVPEVADVCGDLLLVVRLAHL